MLKSIYRSYFCKPAATEVAQRELEEAERQLVLEDIRTEQSRHRAMYLRASIERLKSQAQPRGA